MLAELIRKASQTIFSPDFSIGPSLDPELFYGNLDFDERGLCLDLVEMLASELSRRGHEVTILGVGSTLYSPVFWNKMREHRALYGEQFPIRARDIDIVVTPHRVVDAMGFSTDVAEILDKQRMQAYLFDHTRMGYEVEWGLPYIYNHENNPRPSINTRLLSGTSVDLILADGSMRALKHAQSAQHAILYRKA